MILTEKRISANQHTQTIERKGSLKRCTLLKICQGTRKHTTTRFKWPRNEMEILDVYPVQNCFLILCIKSPQIPVPPIRLFLPVLRAFYNQINRCTHKSRANGLAFLAGSLRMIRILSLLTVFI